MKFLAEMQERGSDKFGSGAYLASRGSRKHMGIDFACAKGNKILSLTNGIVSKIGYPYNPRDTKKGHMRYVQVTHEGVDIRYFYVDPLVKVGTSIRRWEVVGTAQGLLDIYPGITDHIHFEVKVGRTFLNPEEYLKQ